MRLSPSSTEISFRRVSKSVPISPVSSAKDYDWTTDSESLFELEKHLFKGEQSFRGEYRINTNLNEFAHLESEDKSNMLTNPTFTVRGKNEIVDEWKRGQKEKEGEKRNMQLPPSVPSSCSSTSRLNSNLPTKATTGLSGQDLQDRLEKRPQPPNRKIASVFLPFGDCCSDSDFVAPKSPSVSYQSISARKSPRKEIATSESLHSSSLSSVIREESGHFYGGEVRQRQQSNFLRKSASVSREFGQLSLGETGKKILKNFINDWNSCRRIILLLLVLIFTHY